jgi:hypothetical protein
LGSSCNRCGDIPDIFEPAAPAERIRARPLLEIIISGKGLFYIH